MPDKKSPTAKKAPTKKQKAMPTIGTQIDKDDTANDTAQTPFPIVGIGASAGGLEAFEKFFDSMPSDSGMAFVLVVHLAPQHNTLLPELIQRHTEMMVQSAANDLPVAPNHIYIIPPNSSLTIRNGVLYLSKPRLPHGANLPIDTFLDSLATDRGDTAIGIILSGTGSDGSLGIRAIKEAAGTVLAQSQESAAYNGMPNNAIATGLVDFIVAPHNMPEKLIQLKNVRPADKQASPSTQGLDGDAIQKIISLIHRRTGHDFSLYKKNTIYRRIERRLNIQKIHDCNQYLTRIQESPAELEALFKELLIGVTNFFRDPGAFEVLEQLIMSDILVCKTPEQKIRVWVPGCSTGEEAYSIAIVFSECMAQIKARFSIQVFATDLDEDAINIARSGIYPPRYFCGYHASTLTGSLYPNRNRWL